MPTDQVAPMHPLRNTIHSTTAIDPSSRFLHTTMVAIREQLQHQKFMGKSKEMHQE